MKDILSGIKALLRFKTYTTINIIGLAVSVAATLIIIRYIHQEMTVDHFCKELDRLYLLTIQRNDGGIMIGDNLERNNDPNFIDPLKHPEVETNAFCISFKDDYIIIDGYRHQANVLVTDSVFFQLMDYPIISGIKSIQKPDDAIITYKYAQSIFGDKDPIGKQLISSTGSTLTIRGVVDESNTKSSLQFDLITPSNQRQYMDWGMGFCIVRLAKGIDLKKFNEKISKPQSLMVFSNLPIKFGLTPFNGFYFNKAIESPNSTFIRGNKDSITVLSIVACMLLLVGVFNFINIYTVIMLKRGREFGIRKVYGANGSQIFFQIYLENVYMVGISLLIIWTLVEVTSGLFASVYAIPIKSDLIFDLLLSFLLLFGLPFITSIYPFLRYNYTSPITSLQSVNIGGYSIVSRMLFLFIQYVITFCLIVVSLFFVRQLYTMLHTDVGYQTKNIIFCQFLTENTLSRRYTSDDEWKADCDRRIQKAQIIQQKMDACPLFVTWEYGVAPINLIPRIEVECNGEKHKIAVMNTRNKYMDMFGFKLKEGREWDDTDQTGQYKIMINETARRLFHIKNINEASIQPESRLWWSWEERENNPPLQVVGVIEDFRTGHLSRGNVPLILLYYKEERSLEPLMATIVEGKRKEAIDFLEGLYNEVIGEGEFNYSFVEDEIHKLYNDDKRTTLIYVTFAGLAIGISCLGLFGLSLYDIRQRYREIALRKVNGATGRQITMLLIQKYLYVLGIAFIVATPLICYIINYYTEDFVVKIPMGTGIFVIGFVLTLLISLGTLLWQVRKAVSLNPATIMKNE